MKIENREENREEIREENRDLDPYRRASTEAAQTLSEMLSSGEIEDAEPYLTDTEFLRDLLSVPARAAVRIKRERDLRREAEEGLKLARREGEESVLEKLRAREALPIPMRSGAALGGETDFMSMGDEEFRRARERIRRESIYGRRS